MPRMVLSDDQWDRVKDLFPGKATDCGVTAKDNRLFFEAVLWITRTGAPWRDLPEEFGLWNSVYTRYSRWSHKGVWDTIFSTLSAEADFEYVMIDGSIIRVHQHGASAKKSKRKRLKVTQEEA